MKVFYSSFLFLLFSASAFSQDLIYTSDGKSVPGKVTAITADKVTYSATGAQAGIELNKVLFVVNASGNYLVLNGAALEEQEKKDFLTAAAKPLPANVIIQKGGDVIAAESVSENDAELVYRQEGKDLRLKKTEAAALFRKNGTHQLYMSSELAVYPLRAAKPKMVSLLTTTASTAATAEPAPAKIVTDVVIKSSDLNVDMEMFSKKALEKTEEFSTYLQTITAVNTSRDKAMKSIDMACGLFLNEEARVEVSSTNSTVKNKYKIRDYLNRLQFRSGQYDKIIIEYAEINYASEFKKGTDGNYYGVVTFVQKFRGFVDGNVVYGDITKRNLTVVLRQYEKVVDGEAIANWDVFLADLGVVETKKL
ncbi:hypothetical protein [Pontibacter sp. SGAir0037]|uniref:hypothetical protein n=1 Tax=Pontibacter sp. SGAir0037 TaxID=2571030 RepID=UPI0010CD6071|nr:hypothetical protein [Pontibacter sp. SGAir0037]QCR21559.1 hypothetical protein C1N53_03820 [Pontibacter sp. SGAir0037]